MTAHNTSDDLRIEARLRNNVLYHAIFDRWPSVAAFCRETGFHQVFVGKLLNLKMSPLHLQTGEYTGRCQALAATLRFLCEDLFPPHLYGLEHTQATVEIPFSALDDGMAEAMMLLPAPPTEELVARNERDREIESTLKAPHPHQEAIIRMRFGLCEDGRHTVAQAAEKLGISDARVRQIEARALQSMRRSLRVRDLADCLD